MHLKNLKLSGFKSFVDVTVIPFNGQFCSIVGPNGCGKSNIVDAIRWVIGESSAKHLRGQAMTDVIFNGSSARKPVGKAAVELIFDHCEGRITGEYAKFHEIAVRREVDREGQSSYFLNGVHCRRRDIIDIFLGTGLGPRSYAIIEQGMVSQLVEAKPDEMRLHLEEVAGISKYKERRKETESRMNNTRDNLERLNDLHQELTKQYRHLKKQANAAERYQDLVQQQRLIHAQIKALRWRKLTQELDQIEIQIKTFLSNQEEKSTQLCQHEQMIEQARLDLSHQNDQYQMMQKDHYQLEAEINHHAQRLADREQQGHQWQKEQLNIARLMQELEGQLIHQKGKIEQVQQELVALTPVLDQTKKSYSAANQYLTQAEMESQQWQQQWEQSQQHAAQLLQQAEVAKTEWQHCQQHCQQVEKRYRDLTERKNRLVVTVSPEDIEPLAQRAQSIQADLELLKQELTDNQVLLSQQRHKNQEIQQSFEQTEKSLQSLQRKQAAVEALQQSALVNHDQAINQWLKKHNLQGRPRLAQQLQVNAGWELAVETVLNEYFAAICVDYCHDWFDALVQLQRGTLTLLSSEQKIQPQFPANPKDFQKGPTLAEQIQTSYPINTWLSGIYIANNLEEAKILHSQLDSNESVITRDGLWISLHWIRIAKATDTRHGILQREQELRQLQQEIQVQQTELRNLQLKKQQQQQQVISLETKREEQHRYHQKLSTELAEVQAEWRSQQTRLTQIQQQQQHLGEELQDCEQQIGHKQKALEQATQRYETFLQTHQEYLKVQQQLLPQRDEHRTKLQEAKKQTEEQRLAMNQCANQINNYQNKLDLLRQSVTREERQLEQFKQQYFRLNQQITENAAPIAELKTKHQDCIARFSTSEQVLNQVKDQLKENQQYLKQLADYYQQLKSELEEIKTQLQKYQLERQAIVVRQSTLQEQLIEQGFDLDHLLSSLPKEVEMSEWEHKTEQIVSRIAGLGSINLAAIEEYQAINERKNYLEQQQADLNEALNLLTEAIQKIDKETRAKFRETFEQVNQNFQALFPKIFLGGKASLELIENNLLTAGVMVKAQPPGKNNSTIHMLSGGEKALTALALVLALFQLNPAPFCILDEVDAPLDDANVYRFCQLIKEMSQQIQFIVISHNKLTISAAKQLMGITMQEAGVSRLVSVNMEEAIGMITE